GKEDGVAGHRERQRVTGIVGVPSGPAWATVDVHDGRPRPLVAVTWQQDQPLQFETICPFPGKGANLAAGVEVLAHVAVQMGDCRRCGSFRSGLEYDFRRRTIALAHRCKTLLVGRNRYAGAEAVCTDDRVFPRHPLDAAIQACDTINRAESRPAGEP